MRERLKVIYNSLGILFKTIVSTLCVLMFNRGNCKKRIKEFKINDDKKVVSLLANGPSVGDILQNKRELLEGTDLLVLNYFANSNLFFELKPQYYIILDPAYFIKGYGVASEQNAKGEEDQNAQMKANFDKVDWDMLFFVPNSKAAIKAAGVFAENPRIKVVPYNATRVLGYKWFQNYMYSHLQGLPTSRNVLISALEILISLGYKKIYLYGAELSWTRTMDVDIDNGMMFFNDGHFYDKSSIRYFGKGGYKWWLEAIVEMLDGVEQIAYYAEYKGCKVVNRTPRSFLDSFEYEKI